MALGTAAQGFAPLVAAPGTEEKKYRKRSAEAAALNDSDVPEKKARTLYEHSLDTALADFTVLFDEAKHDLTVEDEDKVKHKFFSMAWLTFDSAPLRSAFSFGPGSAEYTMPESTLVTRVLLNIMFGRDKVETYVDLTPKDCLDVLRAAYKYDSARAKRVMWSVLFANGSAAWPLAQLHELTVRHGTAEEAQNLAYAWLRAMAYDGAEVRVPFTGEVPGAEFWSLLGRAEVLDGYKRGRVLAYLRYVVKHTDGKNAAIAGIVEKFADCRDPILQRKMFVALLSEGATASCYSVAEEMAMAAVATLTKEREARAKEQVFIQQIRTMLANYVNSRDVIKMIDEREHV